MFWLTKNYVIPKFDKQSEAALQAYANKNIFTFQTDGLKENFKLIKPNSATIKNQFSISIHLTRLVNERELQAEIKLYPNNWLLGLMGLLILLALVCVFDADSRQATGISFPLLIATPYIYRLYAHKILSELKAILIPGFDESAEGRKEVFRGFANPLRFFLNLQRNLYILFVIVFLTAIILWMSGITDRFFPKP